MSYYMNRLVSGSFKEVHERVASTLKSQGFGVLTEIDVRETMKMKLNVNFPRYAILGACYPTLAYKALQLEDKIGVLLPCNVVVKETVGGAVEVAAMDPVTVMGALDNPALLELASDVRERLKSVLELL